MKNLFVLIIILGVLYYTGMDFYKKIKNKKPPRKGFPNMVAQVMCGGTDKNSPQKYRYDGKMSCTSALPFFDGPKSCDHGCVGLGNCVRVCKAGAIHIIGGIAAVDRSKCTGCGDCVSACAKGIIRLIPKDANFWVCCSFAGNTVNTPSVCAMGCDGCGECANICPESAVITENGKARIDYTKCTSCGKCYDICPKKCIWKYK